MLRTCALLSSAVCQVLPFFPHYPINGAMFGNVYWTQDVCFHYLCKLDCKILNSKNWARYPSSGSRVAPYEQTDMMKLRVALWNFENVPKNELGYEFKSGEWSFQLNATTARSRVLQSGGRHCHFTVGFLYRPLPSLRQNQISVLRQHFKLSDNHFLPHHFQIIYTTYPITWYIIWTTKVFEGGAVATPLYRTPALTDYLT
jgi:hypothetical protein